MKTPFSASSMPAYDYIQLDTYLVDFTTSDTDARSSDSISTQIDFDPAASVPGFANFQYGGSEPDSDISVSSSSLAATARDSDSGSLVFQIAPDNAQNDGTITDHFTGGGDFVFSSDVVTVINADILITATGTDSGLTGDDNFAIVLDSTVDSFEPTATEDSSVVGYEANDGFTVAPPSDFTDTIGNLESGLFYLDSDNGGSGSILSNNSFIFIGGGGPSSVFFSSGGISTGSTLGAQSGPLTSELVPNSSLTYAATAPFDVQLPAAPSNLSNEGNVSSNLPSIMTFGDLGESPASIVQTSSVASGHASSGLVINITYDSSAANAPAGFEAVVASVVQFYESEFTNPITLNIDVGWGEINGQSLGPGALGESESYLESFSYSQIQKALIANATSSNQLSAVSSLPTSAPVNGTFYLTLADATALGLLSSSTILDGYVGFNSSFSYSYNDSSGVPAGEYDLYGVVAHEISEVMGRISMLDSSNGYSDLDLFHYSAPGVLNFVGTTSAYFSGDGGNTNLNYFNSNPSGDFGDWASSAGNDSYDAFSNSGVVNPVTQADITVMNILGYDLTSQTSPVPTITAIVETPSAGDLNAGKTITITLDFSAIVTVAGGTPTLTLNDGGNATYFNGSGSGTLSFTYTVAASDSNVSSLAVTAVNLNGATITDSAGNVQLSLTGLPQSGPQIDTTIPTPTSIVETPSNGIVNIGTVVVFTLGFNEPVTVSGTPTMTLNDGGIATFASGSGSKSLSFSYTASATNSNVAALAATAVNVNGGSIRDGAGNNANLSLTGLTQIGPSVSATSVATEINNIYLAVLQRNATQSEINTSVTADASIGIAAVIADIVNLPEAQQFVYPVIQIIQLAVGHVPTAASLRSWVPYVESGGDTPAATYALEVQMATAFVGSTSFANTYNGGVTVNPNAPVTTTIMQAIIEAALGTVPTAAHVASWVATGLSTAQVFVDFALGGQFTARANGPIQTFLTAAANGTESYIGSLFSASTLAVDDNGVGAETSTAALDVAAADVTALGGVAHNDTGVAVAHLDAPGTPAANGLTTTFNGVAASGELFIGDTFGTAYIGNIVVNQSGTVGSDILTIALGDAASADVGTIQSLTVSDDASLIIYNGYGGDNVIASLVDATNSVQTILIADGAGGGGGELTIGSISDAALKTIDAHLFSGDLILTANQTALTIVGSTGGFELTAGGTRDTISDGTDSAPANTADGIFIRAGGAGDHISVIGGIDPEIGAPGAGDTITVAAFSGTAYLQGNENGHINDTSSPAVSLGAGDTISVGDAAHPGGDADMWVGANSTINLTAGAFADVHLLGDTAGASLTNLTTINGVSGADVRLHFNDTNTAITTEAWAGGTSENSLVNVSGAASLAAALNLAASQAAVEDQQFDAGTNTTVVGAVLQLNAHTGLVDWFRFGGNTFVVEAVNSTATTAAHEALGTNDIVVELTGIVDVNHISVANV